MPQKPKCELPPIPFASPLAVGKRIAIFRKHKGFTQIELAEKIGIDNTLLSHYERGRLHLNEDMIIRFALALNVSTDAILGLDKSPALAPKLKYVKRINKIETLLEKQQKTILQTIDMMIKAAETE
ncbi:MAG: helix-turn-helix domain-containing protein [Treponema sp.]|jgi:transcriptional regulator with XRE-family HTH domain|nr:helix-turn-helix domain-containing protein [Treponema sp.]